MPSLTFFVRIITFKVSSKGQLLLQYLKKNGGVNLLQFCLAVEDFNKKMMVGLYHSLVTHSLHHGHAAYHLVVNLSDDHIDGHAHDHQVVDLPDEKLQALHKEAKALYDSYIKVSQFQKHYFYPD